MKRSSSFADLYELSANRLLRIFINFGVDPKETEVLLSSFGEYMAMSPHASPQKAALERCDRILELTKVIAKSNRGDAPNDLMLVAGFFVDCHVPVILSNTSTHSVYKEGVAPELNTAFPVAIGMPFGTKACSKDMVMSAWFSKAAPKSTLMKLLSKGATPDVSIRYICQQAIKCVNTGRQPREVIREMLLAHDLGAYTHCAASNRHVTHMMNRVNTYAALKTSQGLIGRINKFNARPMYHLLCEYVVAVSTLYPGVWRAASCLQKSQNHIMHALRWPEKRSGRTHSSTKRRQSSTLPPHKLPTATLVKYGANLLAKVIEGDKTAEGLLEPQHKAILKHLRAAHTNNYIVTRLSTTVAYAQKAALMHSYGTSTSTVSVCSVCCVAHVKMAGVSRACKRRAGTLVSLGDGILKPSTCQTCNSSKGIVSVNVIGYELKARARASDMTSLIPITVCCVCGIVSARPTHINGFPTCNTCSSKKPPKAAACICGLKAPANKSESCPLVAVRTSVGQTVCAICPEHSGPFSALPTLPVYSADALKSSLTRTGTPKGRSLLHRRHIYLA